MIEWMNGHIALVATLIVAILDFVVALNPATEANGIFHWIYTMIKSFENGPVAPPAK